MQRVETELRRQGVTLIAFAEKLGVRSQDINNWKNRGIPRTKQRAVADALGWSLDYLLTGRESRDSELWHDESTDLPTTTKATAEQVIRHLKTGRIPPRDFEDWARVLLRHVE